MIGLISSPGYAFINISYAFYVLFENKFENFKNFLRNCVCAFLLIFLGIYLKNVVDIYGELEYFWNDVKLIYTNYFYVNDTLPNMGLIWNLLPSVNIY